MVRLGWGGGGGKERGPPYLGALDDEPNLAARAADNLGEFFGDALEYAEPVVLA